MKADGPLAVVLIVPMCIVAAMIEVNLRGLDRIILVEVGLGYSGNESGNDPRP
jgi:hypothetical protein